jgi:hypothetical protein
MTSNEANQFVSSVLRGLWPRWGPNDEEIRVWTARLLNYNYGRAQKAVDDLFITLNTRGIEPPPGKIMRALKEKAYIPPPKSENQPVLLYSLIKQSNLDAGLDGGPHLRGFYVTSPKKVPAREEIERRAERDRRAMNQQYDDTFVIIYAKTGKGKE